MDSEYESDDFDFEYEEDSDIEMSQSNNHRNSTNVVNSTAQEGVNQLALSSITSFDNVRPKFYNYDIYSALMFYKTVMLPQSQKIASVLSVAWDTALYLLIIFKWNSEIVIEKYMENYTELLKQQGLSDNNNNSSLGSLHAPEEDYMCLICCDDFPDLVSFSLRCGHRFCTNCYSRYVDSQIPKGSIIRCPEHKCNTLFQLDDFKILYQESELSLRSKLVQQNLPRLVKQRIRKYHNVSFGKFKGDESDSEDEEEFDEFGNPIERDNSNIDVPKALEAMKQQYLEMESENDPSYQLLLEDTDLSTYSKKSEYVKCIVNKYVDSHKDIHWCPAPDCLTLIKVNDYIPTKEELGGRVSQLPTVSCLKSHNFCLNCNLENHYPLPCQAAEAWVTKCTKDSETASWINLHTRMCPKCNFPIEKNGGCNHMTCQKCSHQFCWICLGLWSQHGNQYYRCNRYREEDSVKIREESQEVTKRSYTKYLHYFDRFQTHQVSTNKDYKIYEKISLTIKKLQQTEGVSWIDSQFLRNSILVLVKARSTLQWSYVFSYYLKDNNCNAAYLFEQIQTSLSNAVEDLSMLFSISKNITERRLKFIEGARLCVSRQLKLISYVEESLVKKDLVLDYSVNSDYIASVPKKKKGSKFI